MKKPVNIAETLSGHMTDGDDIAGYVEYRGHELHCRIIIAVCAEHLSDSTVGTNSAEIAADNTGNIILHGNKRNSESRNTGISYWERGTCTITDTLIQWSNTR